MSGFGERLNQRQKAFKKGTKRLWRERANSKNKKAKRVRNIDWEDARSDVGPDLGKIHGTSSQTYMQKRMIIFDRLQFLVLSVAAQLGMKGPRYQEMVAKNVEKYYEDVEAEAADSTQATKKPKDTILGKACEYMTTIINGTQKSFLCRHLACLFFGANHQWLRALDGHKFRCPACIEQYLSIARGRRNLGMCLRSSQSPRRTPSAACASSLLSGQRRLRITSLTR